MSTNAPWCHDTTLLSAWVFRPLDVSSKPDSIQWREAKRSSPSEVKLTLIILMLWALHWLLNHTPFTQFQSPRMPQIHAQLPPSSYLPLDSLLLKSPYVLSVIAFCLKGIVQLNMKMLLHLLALMLFQACMIFILLWNSNDSFFSPMLRKYNVMQLWIYLTM